MRKLLILIVIASTVAYGLVNWASDLANTIRVAQVTSVHQY